MTPEQYLLELQGIIEEDIEDYDNSILNITREELARTIAYSVIMHIGARRVNDLSGMIELVYGD